VRRDFGNHLKRLKRGNKAKTVSADYIFNLRRQVSRFCCERIRFAQKYDARPGHKRADFDETGNVI